MKSTAAGLAALGRGPDTMLIHMSPGEVAGLQQLAMAHGGSLTTNPHTGLPEAGFLDKLLPTIIGAGLTIFSGGAINPLTAGLITGGIQAARTGDIGKGLMAGLGAFGGAGLGGALSGMGANAAIKPLSTLPEAAGAVGETIGSAWPQIPNFPSSPEAIGAANAAVGDMGSIVSQQAIDNAAGFVGDPLIRTTNPAIFGSQGLGDAYAGLKQTMQPGGMSQLGTALMGPQGYGGKLGATAAGIGAIGALGGFEQPQLKFTAPQQQASNAKLSGPIRRPYDPERNLYTDYGILQPTYAAKGGEMHSVPQLEDGGFVLTKKAVDGMGKGSNDRGQRAAAAGLGAIPIKGPGTGTSDSIPTTIDGVRPAKVSNGEAYVPQKRVKQAGGAKKLYALMRQAENDARRRAA